MNFSKWLQPHLNRLNFNTYTRVFSTRMIELNLFHFLPPFPVPPKQCCPLLVSPTTTVGLTSFLLYILRHNQTCITIIPNHYHSTTLNLLLNFPHETLHLSWGSQQLFGKKCKISNSWSVLFWRSQPKKPLLSPELFE